MWKGFLIDTENVPESHHPFATENTYLRSDDDITTISKAQLLANAPAQKDGYVVISKVVK
ncbi:Asp-tRNA(Asn)/Glu-tRNA(Gln) amidotransferase subunit GatC [Spiroplasma clarkii]|uniref:Asp-tRNA(Asn)/Glu-tRNA(Gln) amidotransferase subunit GatC n=1 Tax=Spiroplasma clarkii TaxID=2139 RepID=UPI0011BADFA9